MTTTNDRCPRWLNRPLRGEWTLSDYPDAVELFLAGARRRFERTPFAFDRYDALAQYREAVPHDAFHLYVLPDRTWLVDHADCANPDYGAAAAADHLDRDVGFGGLATVALVGAAAIGLGFLGGAAIAGVASLFGGRSK